MSLLSTTQIRKLDHLEGDNLNLPGLSIGSRLQYMDTDGSFNPPSSMLKTKVTADTGGVAAGKIVAISGYDSTNDCPKVKPADANIAAALMRGLYYAPSAITAGATGYVYKSYVAEAVNTNGATVDDPIYLSETAGAWTLTLPTGADAKEIVVGSVVVVSATVGVVDINLGGDGTSTLDVHNLTAASAVPAPDDLVPISDESASGDPALAFTVAELLSALGDLTDHAAAPDVADRVSFTDESAAGDPAHSLAISDFMAVLGDLDDIGAAVQTVDRIPLTDESEAGDPARSATVAAILAAGAAKTATITVVGADLAAAGTGTITIQVVDANGDALAGNYLIETWIGTADDFGEDALTDYSVSTGTQREEITANAAYRAITDSTGKVIMAVDNGGAGSVYAWAAFGGIVVASGEVALTAP